MIRSWTLEHFKSVSERTTLELAPLTIFAGANSSGKSTFIQSILLTAQTIQSMVYSRSAVLNGHIVKLGSYEDIASRKDCSKPISIGFTIEPFQPIQTARLPVSPRTPRREHLESVECEYTFSAEGDTALTPEVLRLQPSLKRFDLSVNYKVARMRGKRQEELQETSKLAVKRELGTIDEILARNGLPHGLREDKNAAHLRYSIEEFNDSEKDEYSIGYRYARRINYKINPKGCSFKHFLPDELVGVYDIKERLTSVVKSYLSEPNVFGYGYSRLPEADQAFIEEQLQNPKVRNFVISSLEKILDDTPESKPKQSERLNSVISILKKTFDQPTLAREFGRLYAAQNYAYYQSVSDRAFQIRELIFGKSSAEEFGLAEKPLSDRFRRGISYCQSFFDSSVRYLGPLRDEPKPVYPIASGLDSKDVGFRGEQTAAVLDIHRKTLINYIPPTQFDQQFHSQFSEAETKLYDAVLEWLEYMGVAFNIRTSDVGKLGHEMQVAASPGDDLSDLIHVGVGVSQVLPILVMSLIAEPGATLVFEQPELHLHPKVQSRLADFFVSMSLLGKQCIVETHSEYLINRLRFRSTLSEGGSVSEKTLIYFVEKERGQSVYRKITMNKFGVLAEWPNGFFDESEKLASSIMKAAMEKRRREATGAND